jgi:hypothetical protein
MNTLKCFLTSMMIALSSFAYADPRTAFSSCMSTHLRAAMVQRLSLSAFIETMKSGCGSQELMLISAPVAAATDLPEIAELNARHRKRREAFVAESREINTILYSNWLASTAR